MHRPAAMKSQMRRRVLIMLLFVSAGCFTTLAIAWAAAWWRPMSQVDSLIMGRVVDYEIMGFIGHGEIGPAWGAFTIFGETLPPYSLLDIELPGELPVWARRPTNLESTEDYAGVTIGAGWPMISFIANCEGVAHHEPPPGGAWHTGLGPQWVDWKRWHGAIGNPDPLATPGPAQQKILPVGVRPIGLLVNTAFWTIVWWLPIAVVMQIRRRRRMKRGRCPSCGYDLRGNLAGGCSECGWNRAGPRVLAGP